MKKILSLLLIFTLLFPTIAMAEAQQLDKEDYVDIQLFLEVYSYIKKEYPLEYEDSKILEGALKGMLESLDPYSSYYNVEEAEDLYKQLTGSFSGIGIYIEPKEGYINVRDTIKGQPAETAGVKKGDLIIKVDNKDIANMPLQQVSKLIQGPKDTTVKLSIKRGEKLLDINVKRAVVSISPVDYKIIDDKIGYIEIAEFTKNVSKEIEKILRELDKKNLKKIILDVRDNPGGLLTEVVSISDLFIEKGPIVHIKQNKKPLITHVSTLEKPKYEIVVLINGNSASASEILAGAVKERKTGKVIGTTTYGKGTVQTVISMDDGSVLKMTTAEYLLPNKTSINGKGVEPDIKVENTEKEDLQLKKAIEILK
ncbi:S41 family peptidase [Tissierella sp.]|uniref:S41 family peptidase n=1 Tax=Tissierella sp. TaxID=41274 RepID=UPI0028A79787|nr:S41 family peptidase [Tissierella sp.]